MQTAELSFVVILGVMAAFYFIFIRPARKEQTRLEETIRNLGAGDEIITTAGFFARIVEIRTPEEGPVEMTLDFGDGRHIRALITSVSKLVTRAEDATTPPTTGPPNGRARVGGPPGERPPAKRPPVPSDGGEKVQGP